MAKFDKDVFLAEMTDKVKEAIESGLISQEDINNNDVDRLTGFLQYSLSDYLVDRKNAIDVLRDFNYDERYSWESLEEQIGGKIKSLFDVALANLWKFLEASGLLTFAYYVDGVKPESTKPGKVVDYSEDEFDDDFELAGEINDEEDEFEDYADEFDEEVESEDNDIEESVEYDYCEFDFDEEDDDFKYNEMVRRRNASQRRNFKRSR